MLVLVHPPTSIWYRTMPRAYVSFLEKSRTDGTCEKRVDNWTAVVVSVDGGRLVVCVCVYVCVDSGFLL